MKKIALVSMVVITLFMALSLRAQFEVYKDSRAENNLLNEQLTSLEKDIKNLEDELELIDTDEYIEKIAREKLGYIKSNEFVFREKD